MQETRAKTRRLRTRSEAALREDCSDLKPPQTSLWFSKTDRNVMKAVHQSVQRFIWAFHFTQLRLGRHLWACGRKKGINFFLSCCVDVCIALCVWASKAFCMPSVWVRIHVYINSDFIHLSVFSSPPLPPHPKVCLVLMVMGNRVRRQASGGARRSRQINDPTAAFRSELRHISFPTGRGEKNPPVLDYLQTPSLTPSPPVLSVLNALLPSPSMWTIIL